MRISLSLLCLLCYASYAQQPFSPIEKSFPLKWKAKIGIASFKTNVVFNNGTLIIGSNGSNFMDYNAYDKQSGVYVINRKTGGIIRKIGGEELGDMDVNGTLLHNNKLYFGNDNEEFLCTNLDGKVLWRNPASGDIEHEPVLVSNKNKQCIVYATESGEVKAVDPETGLKIWNYYTPDFKGWKPGDNRMVFKVKAYFSNSNSFYIKPLLVDLNIDGVNDLVYVTYDEKIFAINGNDGKLLWKKNYQGLNSMIANIGTQKEPLIFVTHSVYNSNDIRLNKFDIINRKGNTVKQQIFGSNDYVSGLNALNIDNGKLMFACRDSIMLIDKVGNYSTNSRVILYDYVSINGDWVKENRNGYSPILANNIFLYKGLKSALVLNQRDYANSNTGFVEIVSIDQGKVLERYALPSASEMPPVIDDIDMDGKLDLLISGFDGYLYCYSLNIKK
jgi:outer membrane protein assembly factor BamB